MTQFNQRMAEASKNVETVAGKLAKFSTEHLKKFSDHMHEAGKKTGETVKRFSDFGKELTATAGGLYLAMKETTEGLESLYWMSQRTGTTATNIATFSSAVRGVGLSGSAAKQALESLADTMQRNPGRRSFMAALGIDPNQQGTQQILATAERLSSLPLWMAARFSERMGMPWSFMRNLMTEEGRRKFREEDQQRRNTLLAWGTNFDVTAKKSEELGNKLGRLEFHFEALKNRLFDDLKPAFEWLLDSLEIGAEKFAKWNKEQGGVPLRILAIAGSFAAAGIAMRAFGLVTGVSLSGLATAAGALFGVGGLLGAGVLAIAGLAAWDLYKNWDKVGPLLGKQFEGIKAAFDKSFILGIVVSIRDMGTDIRDAIDFAFNQLLGLDVSDQAKPVGERLAKAVAEGFASFMKTEGPKMVTDALRDFFNAGTDEEVWKRMKEETEAARKAQPRPDRGPPVWEGPIPPPLGGGGVGADQLLAPGGAVRGRKMAFGGGEGDLDYPAATYRMFNAWLSGDNSFRPFVVISDEFYDKFRDMLRDMSGGAGGGSGAGGSARGLGGIGGRFRGMGPMRGAVSHPENIKVGMDYLMNSEGMTKEQAAGVMGWLVSESRLDPKAINASGHKGVAQWDRSRWGSFISGLKAGEDPNDFLTQMKHLSREWHSSEARSYAAIKAATSVAGANEGMGLGERSGNRYQGLGSARDILRNFGAAAGIGGARGGDTWLNDPVRPMLNMPGLAPATQVKAINDFKAAIRDYSKIPSTSTPGLGVGGALQRSFNINSDHKVEMHLHGVPVTSPIAQSIEDVQGRQSALHIRNLRNNLG